jgi:formiminotetrahydrofolate cyclodeaminase
MRAGGIASAVSSAVASALSTMAPVLPQVKVSEVGSDVPRETVYPRPV